MDRTRRNWGIDALRIVSMFLIVLMHTLKQGGILEASSVNDNLNRVAWFLEVMAFGAVNCYALVSGYVGYRSCTRISKWFLLWMEVFFYSFTITLVFAFTFPGVINLQRWVKAFFPILAREYWYISCYFCLLFLMPVINRGIREIEDKNLKKLVIILLIFSSLLPTMLKFYPFNLYEGIDAFGMMSGYSTLWLLLLYVVGAYISKAEWTEKCNGIMLILIIMASILITWESLFFMPKWTAVRFGEVRYGSILLSYTSPTIVLASVCALILFAKIGKKDVGISETVQKFGKTTLAVYLIHTHPLIWDRFMAGFAVKYTEGSSVLMVLRILGACAVIYILCTIIELFRLWLFKIIKVDKICLALERRLIKENEGENANN